MPCNSITISKYNCSLQFFIDTCHLSSICAVFVSFQKPFLFGHQSIILSSDYNRQLWIWWQALEDTDLVCQVFCFSFLPMTSLCFSLASLWNTASVHCHRTSGIMRNVVWRKESRVCPPPPGPFRPRVSGVPGCPQIILCSNQPGGNGIFSLLPNYLNTRPLLIRNLTRTFSLGVHYPECKC